MNEDKNTDIYYKLGEMHGDIKSTLAEAKRTNGRVTKIEEEKIPGVNKRIDKIELRLAYYVGIAAVILFLINIFAPKLIDKYL
jgi:hypothetical protein